MDIISCSLNAIARKDDLLEIEDEMQVEIDSFARV